MFLALWYLLGSVIHVRFGLANNQIYARFGTTSLFAFSRQLWSSAVMPRITFFALLLATFEMTTGILILSKGRYVKVGLVASLLFNLFLVQLGLGYSEIPWSGRDFLLNCPTCYSCSYSCHSFGYSSTKACPSSHTPDTARCKQGRAQKAWSECSWKG